MIKDLIFPYSWHVIDNDDNCEIYIYGIGRKDKSMCIKVINFQPYIYLELSPDIEWHQVAANQLSRKIDEMCGHDDQRLCKDGCLCSRPLKVSLEYRKKLYFANVGKDYKNKYTYRKFAFLKIEFQSQKYAKQFAYKARRLNGSFIMGQKTFGYKVHEQDAKPELQLACMKDIPTAGWILFAGEENKGDEEKETTCEKEYVVKWQNLKKSNSEDVPRPLILSFDIEVNSSDPNRMPDANKPKDKIFQISCVLGRQGCGEDKYEKYLLTLGSPDEEIVDNTEIWEFKTEGDLLDGFADFVVEKNPQLIIGYNILGFDIPYMIDRADLNLCSEFRKFGCRIGVHAENKMIKWSSSAYGTQEFQFLDAEGRLFVDLLPLVKRDYKFDNYKLKTVSEFFLGETKDPLTAKGIFKCYKIGLGPNCQENDGTYTKKSRKALGIVGKYCVQDSALVLKLFETIQTWVGLCEMAKTCNVPIFYLYTQGQQIKVFSQVYKHCMYNNFVVEKDGYEVKENEQYTGAYVVQPVPGAYDRVVPFDFTSLYPTTIIAYNIDYSTLVEDESIPDEDCNIIEWEDHVGCEHDTMVRATKPKNKICAAHRYRFLKEPMGVIPTLLQNLLNARKKTKGEMKDAKKKANEATTDEEREKWETRYTVLNKRQLAFKVSANSMYGAMGVKRGYLPFLPGAMCTTAKGRQSIELAGKTIQERYKGQLVYGDTDSCYIHFPFLDTAEQCWDFCLQVENELLTIFPPPMKLAFEEVVYWRFFILTKKRYMALSCGRDGIVEDKIMKKGVLLARRDNSKFIRNLYEKVIMDIFNKKDKDDVLYMIFDYFNQLCSNKFSYKDFVVTKSIQDISDYKIRELPTDYKKRMKRLQDLGIFYHTPSTYEKHMKSQLKYHEKYGKRQSFDDFVYNTRDRFNDNGELMKCGECKDCKDEYGMYKLKALPAQVQLAEKMRRRGMRVDAGSRIEYLVTTQGGIKGKQFEKIEDPEYQQQHSDIIKIDFLYYLKLAANPLDQALDVAYKTGKIIEEQYKLRVQKHKFQEQIKCLNKEVPKIEFL